MRFSYGSDVVPDLLTLPRATVENKLRTHGELARQKARQTIADVVVEEELVRSRASKNAADNDEDTAARSLEWLARAVAGETAKEIARTTKAATRDYEGDGRPKAGTVSNGINAAAKLLGLEYNAPRGRPRKKTS